MRKTSPLIDSLLLPIVQDVLAATVLRPNRDWYLSDLASHLGLRPSSLQRTLQKLVRAGILTRRQDGNRVYYRADPACPILAELSGILTKTVGIAEPLRQALMPLSTLISFAFIHGSVAEGRERSESDIDIVIVGEAPGADVAFALRPLQERLGREINVTRYSLREFPRKVASRHHFLSSVLRRPKIFLIGGEHELDKIVGREARGIGAHQQAGA